MRKTQYRRHFKDPEAERISGMLDYDFAEKGKKMESAAGLFGALEVAQRQYDLVSLFHKLMIKFCDGLVKMQIVKIMFM